MKGGLWPAFFVARVLLLPQAGEGVACNATDEGLANALTLTRQALPATLSRMRERGGRVARQFKPANISP